MTLSQVLEPIALSSHCVYMCCQVFALICEGLNGLDQPTLMPPVLELQSHLKIRITLLTEFFPEIILSKFFQGLFFGLLVLVSALICLILFFVLIDHGELHVSQLAVFLADISHASIMLLSLLAILLGFCRIKQIKFHGEEDSLLTTGLLKVMEN